MNARAAARVLLLLLTATGTLSAQPRVPEPIHTKTTRFRIPFRFDADELQRIGAREVRLYVSNDRGRNWTVGGTTDPRERRFDFQATGDGEYWFAVRTVDARNELHPPGPIDVPALTVVVDTQPPRLEVRLTEVEPGRVQLAWSADDPHLDPAQLRLEYREPGQNRWQQVSVIPKAAGRTTWTIAQPGLLAVRGVVGDHASNVGQARAQLALGRAGPPSRDPVPDLRQPIAEAPTPARQPAPRRVADASDLFTAHTPGTRPDVLQPRYDDVDTPTSPLIDDGTRSQLGGTPLTAPVSGARVVNSRTFTIDYQIDDVGPSGLSAVEFYITTNGGTKWWRYGDDADLRSPFNVSVPEDGLYGFALRARSGVGLAADPPQPGERPSIVIAVDRTAPEVKLLPVQQGRGDAVDKIQFRWTVRDANPVRDAVSLSYAPGPNGPWKPMTDWMPDRGSYVWTVDRTMPARFHVQLAARDAAGNVTRVRTPEPVVVDLVRPSARIVDVQPGDPSLR